MVRSIETLENRYLTAAHNVVESPFQSVGIFRGLNDDIENSVILSAPIGDFDNDGFDDFAVMYNKPNTLINGTHGTDWQTSVRIYTGTADGLSEDQFIDAELMFDLDWIHEDNSPFANATAAGMAGVDQEGGGLWIRQASDTHPDRFIDETGHQVVDVVLLSDGVQQVLDTNAESPTPGNVGIVVDRGSDFDGNGFQDSLRGGVQSRVFGQLDINHDNAVDAIDVVLACERFHPDDDTMDQATVVRTAGFVMGDANLDGEIGFEDFLELSRGFGQEEAGWNGGDFNCDDNVDFADFLILSRNFGAGE